MSLYHGRWNPDILLGLERLYTERFDFEAAPLWDIDNVDASLLQFLAYDLAADAWTDILGVAYERSILKRSWELNLYRGTEESIHRFADMAGFGVSVTYTASGTPLRNRSASVYITPIAGQAADADFLAYVTRVIRGAAPRLGLLPWTLSLQNIFVASDFTVGVNVGMGFQTFDYVSVVSD